MFEKIIGQPNLKRTINKQLIENSFPRFSIFVGPKGSGKKVIAYEIAKQLSDNVIGASNVKMETLKMFIDASYELINKTTYVIPDIDDMSLSAKNSLLKVLEEPPNNAYWILTINNIDNTLPTIRSRGTIYTLEPYSKDDLTSFIPLGEDTDILLEICDTPGDIQSLLQIDYKKFYEYVDLVIDNIAEVSGANSFKIASKLNLKKDGEGYDLNLFWNAFKAICRNRMIENKNNHDEVYKYSQGIVITTSFQNELGITGINKVSLVDDWILTIREYWNGY